MTDMQKVDEEIAKLKHENAELSGLSLATGVILTQLLQTICKRELNPQAAASRIITAARERIVVLRLEGYSPTLGCLQNLGQSAAGDDRAGSPPPLLIVGSP